MKINLPFYSSHKVSRKVYWWIWNKMYVGKNALSKRFPYKNRVECNDPQEVTCIQWATVRGIDIEVANTECQVMFSDYFRFEVGFLGIRIQLFLEFFAEEDDERVHYTNVWGGSNIEIGRGKVTFPKAQKIYQFSPNSERRVTEI